MMLLLLADSEPDTIAITGNLINANHADVDVAVSFAQETALVAPVYYVSGNHEARCSE